MADNRPCRKGLYSTSQVLLIKEHGSLQKARLPGRVINLEVSRKIFRHMYSALIKRVESYLIVLLIVSYNILHDHAFCN